MEKFWYNDTQLTLAGRKASKHIRKFDTGGKKNMKKRILSILLAVLMLLSVLPISALAAEESTPEAQTEPTRGVSANSEDNAVHVTKSVSEDGKTLTLEAYATNSVSTHTSYEPLDIVLVLDVSGSMDYCVNCGAKSWGKNDTCGKKPESEYPPKGKAKDLTDKDGTLYVYNSRNGKYKEVQWCDGGHFGWSHAPGWYDGDNRIGDETTLYQKVTPEGKKHQSRIDALKTAVNTFIDSVAKQKDSEGKAIANKISLVKFAGTKIDWTGSNEGNKTYEDGLYIYNNSQVVKGLTDASTGKDALKTAVNSLTAAGATSADFGMELAKAVLDGRTDKTRKSVVIMFTDGEPNHDNGFSDQVASDAIAAAKTLKDGKTLVYTIGMFTNANPADTTSKDINKYMHAVSSNYPNARYVDEGNFIIEDWEWYLGNRADNSNYYLAASSSSQLSAIFQTISQDIGTLTAKVDESSVLSDTLSDMFDFDPVTGDVADSITVKKVPVTGKDANGNYTWDYAKAEDITQKVDVSVVGTEHKTLKVEGFDYGANAVTTTEKDGKVTYKGYKLVVTIPIKPDTEYHGWADGANYYDTNSTANGSKAGLEYGETGSRQKLELNDSPEAPVTGYTVRYQFTNNGPESARLPDAAVYIEGQQYEIAGGYNVDGWTFTGWCPDEDGATTLSDRQIMGTEPVTYYGKWEQKQPGVTVEKTAKRIRNGIEEDLPSGTGTVRVDDTIKYTVKATNTGNVELRNVSILECFGGRNKFEDDKTKQKVSGLFDRYGFTIAQTLAPGATATRTFTYVVTDADEDHGEIKNHLEHARSNVFRWSKGCEDSF